MGRRPAGGPPGRHPPRRRRRLRLVRRPPAHPPTRPDAHPPGASRTSLTPCSRRHADDGSRFLFVINHTDDTAEVPAHGRELLHDRDVAGRLVLPPLDTAVVHER
ncbi:Beta-galactosidase C-terminal domain [Streptomyces sp. NPDC085927]|uniref:Beta-galactosidase C-terminal domain n=1 Tax=Streptomyces sp. NPDC085927 TaxID=3365738 RepID=UPI0037D22334